MQSALPPHRVPRPHQAAQVRRLAGRLRGTRSPRATCDRAAGLFGAASFWRDLVAFTWNITTVEGRDGVRDLLRRDARPHRPARLPRHRGADRGRRRRRRLDRVRDRRRAAAGACSGSRDGRAWTLLTALYELKGHEEPLSGAARRAPSTASAGTGRPGWSSRAGRGRGAGPRRPSPTCVVVGGGQGGIALGARLRQLDVPHIVDRPARPARATSGASRYKSLCLHDPVWYDHLPYLPFPTNWPVFSPKDKIADWLEIVRQGHGAQLLGLAPTCRRRRYDEATREWTVDGRAGRRASSRCGPKQLVLATGMSGQAEPARLPGRGHLRAATSTTRREHPGPDAYRGRKARRHRLEQLGARHLPRPVGARRRRHDGAALVDAHRARPRR